MLSLIMRQTDLGQYTLAGGVGFAIGITPSKPLVEWQEGATSFAYGNDGTFATGDPGAGYFCVNECLATGQLPAHDTPKNEAINARLARDPALHRHVSVEPATNHQQRTTPQKVTTADVLEALHRATGMPIVADFYTRLYPQAAVSVRDQPLFEVLNRLADTMRMRWRREDRWLQLRSVTFYHDRLKEVPNRLLARWAASRRERGTLAPDDLIEIARLSEAQLDATEMAEGARECWGLKEWDLARARYLRSHLRFFAGFAPDQRREAMRTEGLPFTRIPLSQQQQFLALLLGARADAVKVELEDLAHATLQVKYHVVGGMQWEAPEQPDGPPKLVPRPPVPDSRRQALLENARRFNDQRSDVAVLAALQPEPDLEFTYIIGVGKERPIRRWVHITGGNSNVP